MPARERADGGTDEQLEGDGGRDGVAGEAEQEDRGATARSIGGPERERLAGLDGDPPEVDAADGLDGGLDDVVGPDRDAARDDEGVGAVGEGRSEPGQDVVEVVAGDAEIEGLAACGGHERPKARAVGVGDAGRAERLAGCADLVAGREDGDARQAVDEESLDAGARQQRHGRRGDRGARLAGGSCRP